MDERNEATVNKKMFFNLYDTNHSTNNHWNLERNDNYKLKMNLFFRNYIARRNPVTCSEPDTLICLKGHIVYTRFTHGEIVIFQMLIWTTNTKAKKCMRLQQRQASSFSSALITRLSLHCSVLYQNGIHMVIKLYCYIY